jgi:hypothetical protein
MTFSNKFSSLDCREAALLDDLRGDARASFERLCAGYDADFRPSNEIERDSVYCLATLRWGIDRVRACESAVRDACRAHGYQTPKLKLALEELAGYQRELNNRYEYFFSALERIQRTRLAA